MERNQEKIQLKKIQLKRFMFTTPCLLCQTELIELIEADDQISVGMDGYRWVWVEPVNMGFGWIS